MEIYAHWAQSPFVFKHKDGNQDFQILGSTVVGLEGGGGGRGVASLELHNELCAR